MLTCEMDTTSKLSPLEEIQTPTEEAQTPTGHEDHTHIHHYNFQTYNSQHHHLAPQQATQDQLLYPEQQQQPQQPPHLKLLPSPAIVTSTSESDAPPTTDFKNLSTRPVASRSFTDPTSPSFSNLPSSPNMKISTLALRPRNTSPYARPHLRSRSTASSLSAPPITRSYSSPIVDTFASSPIGSSNGRPASPSPSPSPLYPPPHRRASPLRRPLEESFSSFNLLDVDQTISENSELDITPRQPSSGGSTNSTTTPNSHYNNYHSASFLDHDCSTSAPHTPSSPLTFSVHGTFPRTRRRPSSPLHVLPANTAAAAGTGNDTLSMNRLHTSSSSPALRSSPSPSSPATSAKYNEAFPTSGTPYASSVASAFSISSSIPSIPSTPTSFRSRSPSISSLETIPDSPDAEREAVEQAERELRERENNAVARLKVEAEKEGVRGRGRFRDGARSSERKRWSVCGAERRADLDVIWED